MNIKGSLPLLILYALSKENLHGYAIAKQIKEQSEGVLDFKEGTLYPTLHKLKKLGFINTYSEVEKGRKRHYYHLTEKGKQELAAKLAEWHQFTGAVNNILDGARA
ncbi:MAG: PadR family transcriptional regulator [Aggregatilineales bacterium]